MAFHFRSTKGERILPQGTAQAEQIVTIVSKLSPSVPRSAHRPPAAAHTLAHRAAGPTPSGSRPKSATPGGAGPRPKTGTGQRPVSRAASVERVLAGMEADITGRRPGPRLLPPALKKPGALPPLPRPVPPPLARSASGKQPLAPLPEAARRRALRWPAPQEGAPVLQLPSELLERVMGLLPLVDLIALEHTCAGLRAAVDEAMPRACGRVEVDARLLAREGPALAATLAGLAGLFARASPNATSFRIEGLDLAGPRTLAAAAALTRAFAGARRWPHLAELSGAAAASDDLRAIALGCPALAELRLRSPPLQAGFEPADAGRLLASLRRLESVELEGPGLTLSLPDLNALLRRPAPPALRGALAGRALAAPRADGEPELTDVGGLAAAHGPSLVALHLREDAVAPGTALALLRSGALPQLTELHLHLAPSGPAPAGACSRLAAGALRALAGFLEVLVVTGQGTVAGADLAAFVRGGGPAGRRLRELDLSEGVLLHCCDGSSIDLAALGERHGRTLRRLGLPRTLGGPSRAPAHLVQLLARAPGLQRLRASLEGGGEGEGGAGQAWLADHCAGLEALEVRRACNVPPEDLAAFLQRALGLRRLHLSINVQGPAAVRAYHASFPLLAAVRPEARVTRSALATGSALAPAAVGVDAGSMQVVVSLGCS